MISRAAISCAGLLAAALLHAGTISVVVDTDAGSDDMLAISLLLARPDVRIEAIGVVHGLAHVPEGAENIRKLLAVAGRENIPVYLGREQPIQKTAEFPVVWRRITDSLLDGVPAPNRSPQRADAVTYYRGRAFTGATVLALGPLTNIAAAIKAGARFDQIAMMGGALRVPGNLGDGGYFKTTNKTAEWNVFCDPEAARIVFASGAAIRMVPLDATNTVPLDLRFLEDFQRGARSPLAKTAALLLEGERELIGHGIFYAWDPLAAAALVEPAIGRWRTVRVRIRADGTTEETAEGVPVQAALDADAARFRQLFLTALR
jgi:purine nucleosidase